MNELQRLLGIRLPIIQRRWPASRAGALKLAVSGAGGLGSLACAALGPQALTQS